MQTTPIALRTPRLRRLSGWVSSLAPVLFFLLFAYTLFVQWTLWRAGKFAFNDFGLVRDFLANTAWGRGFFYVSETRLCHFEVHFTPTLLLVLPLFRWIESPFLLQALSTLACFVGVFFALKLYLLFAGPERKEIDFPVLALLILLVLNRYTKSLLLSSHFEPFFLATSVPLFYFLLTNRGRPLCLVLLFLSLGVRQDAALYLIFQLLSLLVLPRYGVALSPERRRFIGGAAALCLVYFLVVVGAIMPLFGAKSHAVRFWSHLGNSYSEVLVTVLTSPRLVADEIARSAIFSLNLYFAFLPWRAWPIALLINVPGGLLYLTRTAIYKQLYYYTSTFLLSGFFFGSALGMARLSRRAATGWSAVIVLAMAATFGESNAILKFWPHPAAREPRVETVMPELSKCPAVRFIATDSENTAFVPHRFGVMPLDRYEYADAVVIDRGATNLERAGSFNTIGDLEAQLKKDRRFIATADRSNLGIYLREGVVCAALH